MKLFSGFARARHRRLAVAAIAVGLVVTACSSSPSSTATGNETTAATSSPATATTSSGAATSSNAASTTAASGPVSTGKELVWGSAVDYRTLFAPTDFSSDGLMVMTLIQGQMMTFDQRGGLQPAIASSYEAKSPTEYVYTIDDKQKFSDGSPVTAEDVAFSLNLHLDPKVASQEASLMANVKSATAQGNTVTVELKKPDSLWKFLPASITGLVYQKKSVEANLSTYGTPQTFPIGAGPYKVTEYVPGSHVTLERNPYYAGTPTEFDKITFRIIPDDNTRLLALKQGDIQGTHAIPASALSQWQSAATVQIIPGLVWRGLTLDMSQKPFDDIHVRKALYYATNRQDITAGLTPGMGRVSTTVNDPTIFKGALSDSEIADGYNQILTLPYDMDKAKQEMAASSVPQGFSTTLNVPEDVTTLMKIAQVLKASWAQIGVDLKINPMPGGPRFQIILDHGPNLGIQIIGNVPDAPDPTEMVYQYFHSEQAAKNGNNSSNLRDPAIDELITKAQAASDVKESAQLAMQAQALASQQVPIIPILWSDQAMAVKKGWTLDSPGSFWQSSLWINSIHPN